jgi:murein DD-endopeptidase MepM/ murein hydrolase activator NlpD
VANHRAERRVSRRVPSSSTGDPAALVPPSLPGKRRAVKSTTRRPVETAQQQLSRRSHAGGRKNLLPGLPSAPTLIGAAAVTLAAVGATVSQQGSPSVSASNFQKFASQASVLNAASSMGSGDSVSGRQRAVSRDSQREALQDAAQAELQKAAESQAKERNAALAALAASAEKHADQIAKNLWQLPLPAGSYRVSNNFGHCSYLWVNCHTGEDLSAPSGTPIYSVAAGTVTEVGYDGSYGNKTVVTLEDGTELWYCHQTSFTVSAGETVRPGQQIGTVGSTGNSTGPHLHLEVHPGAGDAVDPVSALAVRGVHL